MSRERNIKLTIEYDGSGYSGWQFQPGQKTIQGEIEKALKKLTGQRIVLYAAGRTDAGVHALGQVANFKVRHRLPTAKFSEALNFYLPKDILIHKSEEVSLDFHARYDAVYRHYRYLVAGQNSVHDRDRKWLVGFSLDENQMELCAQYIKGDHDFSTFCVVSSQRDNNRCLAYRSSWHRNGGMLIYDIVADRFLHTMIRSLVGLMVDVGRGALSMKEFREIFRSGNHTLIKKVAPSRGLYLVAIGY